MNINLRAKSVAGKAAAAIKVPTLLILNPDFFVLIINQGVLQLDLTLPNPW